MKKKINLPLGPYSLLNDLIYYMAYSLGVLEIFTVSSSKGRTRSGDTVNVKLTNNPFKIRLHFFTNFLKNMLVIRFFSSLNKAHVYTFSYRFFLLTQCCCFYPWDQSDQSFNLFVINQYDSLELHNNF